MKRLLRCAAAGAAIALLSGCVVAPVPYGYGYGYAPGYAYAPPAYYGPAYPAVGVDVGACFGCGHFHRW
jgi:hypothetical protein